MIIYTTTPEQRVEVFQIAADMSKKGLSANFISGAVALASEYEGAYDLMKLWAEDSTSDDERSEICADLEDLIDEHLEQLNKVTQKPRVDFDELAAIGKSVYDFKTKLRQRVDQKGGITALAASTGMCQSSLSRFFNSASMPRRTTLYRIARSLDIPESEIVTDWIR